MLPLLAVAGALSTVSAAGTYPLAQSWSGQNFFQGWDWYNFVDNTTWSNVTYVDQATAQNSHMAYVNANGQVVLGIDNTTVVPNGGLRNSIRITSQNGYGVGSVFAMDATHLPFGCSVWPSYWTTGPQWPQFGELDIMEGINLQVQNGFTVHTGNTTQCTATRNALQSGSFDQSLNCATVANSNQAGCTVTPPNALSTYGADFAQAGGGVFAAELYEGGVTMWFFQRGGRIPTDLSSGAATINTAAWPTPVAQFNIAGADCPMTTAFGYQQIVLNIALCGLFAGYQNIYDQTCGAVRPGNCYTANVVGNGANYQDAYFELNYMRVYSSNVSVAAPAPAPSASASAPSNVVALAATTAAAAFTSITTPVGPVVKSGANSMWISAAGALFMGSLGMLTLVL